jgi:hypothetical protein
MRKIETVIHIHKSPGYVWSVLINFKDYPEWNPLVTRISGDVKEGANLSVTVTLPGKDGINFTPKVLKAEPLKEFRWKGKLIFKGLFDGEHYFLLEPLPNGSTALRHGEIFTGILPPFMKGTLQKTKSGFELMNVALKEYCENENSVIPS